MMDDRRLLTAFRRGSDRAARRLLALHGPAMAASARAVLPPADGRADDAVQQVLLALLDRPARELRTVRDARAYLCRAARHAALNMARADRRRRARDLARERAPSGEPGRDPELTRAVDALTPEHREVVLLRHTARLTFDQIALATGLPRSTVASRHAAALDQLRARLAPEPRLETTR